MIVRNKHFDRPLSPKPYRIALLAAILWTVVCVGIVCGQSIDESAQIAIYVQRAASTGDDVRIPVEAVTLTSTVGQITVPLRHGDLSNDKARPDQEMMATLAVPPATYETLTLAFGDVQARIHGEQLVLVPDPAELTFRLGTRLDAGQANAVLLVWTPLTGEAPDSSYQIRLRRTDVGAPPQGSLAFVTNQASNTVAVIDRFTQLVVDILPGGRKPAGIAYSRTHQQLYVAASGDDRVLAFDIAERRLIRQINLSANDQPTRLLVNEVDNELYVLNRGSNSLSVIDMLAYQEIDRQVVADQAQSMAFDPLRRRLLITSSNAQQIEVYDLASRTIATTYPVSGTPGEILTYSSDELMLVALQSQRALMLLDANSGNQQAVINVCAEVSGLALNTATGQVFAALSDCKEIAILRPENQLTLGRIRLSDDPGLLSLEPENRRLLVTLPASDRIAFVNVNSKRVEGEIEVGDEPYQVIVPD